MDDGAPAPSAEDCVSKKPWSEVLNRSAKLFVFRFASEGGRSFGRVLFFLILGLLALGLAAYVVDGITGWFGGFFDFLPFRGDAKDTASGGWFGSGATEPEPAADPASDGTPWYCLGGRICGGPD